MGFVIVSQSNLATIRNSVEIIANVIHDCRPILVQSLKQTKDKNANSWLHITISTETECTNYMVYGPCFYPVHVLRIYSSRIQFHTIFSCTPTTILYINGYTWTWTKADISRNETLNKCRRKYQKTENKKLKN